MSVQTEIYFCFVSQVEKSIIHAGKLVHRKGSSGEHPDGTPQMPHRPINLPAKAAAAVTESPL